MIENPFTAEDAKAAEKNKSGLIEKPLRTRIKGQIEKKLLWPVYI
jgi:hypothetical protein